jgi:hypothetical protein
MAESLRLSEQQRADLDEIAPSPFLPAGVVFRAKLILRVADELPLRAGKQDCKLSRPVFPGESSGPWGMNWTVVGHQNECPSVGLQPENQNRK